MTSPSLPLDSKLQGSLDRPTIINLNASVSKRIILISFAINFVL